MEKDLVHHPYNTISVQPSSHILYPQLKFSGDYIGVVGDREPQSIHFKTLVVITTKINVVA